MPAGVTHPKLQSVWMLSCAVCVDNAVGMAVRVRDGDRTRGLVDAKRKWHVLDARNTRHKALIQRVEYVSLRVVLLPLSESFWLIWNLTAVHHALTRRLILFCIMILKVHPG